MWTIDLFRTYHVKICAHNITNVLRSAIFLDQSMISFLNNSAGYKCYAQVYGCVYLHRWRNTVLGRIIVRIQFCHHQCLAGTQLIVLWAASASAVPNQSRRLLWNRHSYRGSAFCCSGTRQSDIVPVPSQHCSWIKSLPTPLTLHTDSGTGNSTVHVLGPGLLAPSPSKIGLCTIISWHDSVGTGRRFRFKLKDSWFRVSARLLQVDH